MEGFSDGSSTLPASTKKKDMTMCHVFLFGFRPPEAASSLRYFKYSGQMNYTCAKALLSSFLSGQIGASPGRHPWCSGAEPLRTRQTPQVPWQCWKC